MTIGIDFLLLCRFDRNDRNRSDMEIIFYANSETQKK